jgi:hypothetical protein
MTEELSDRKNSSMDNQAYFEREAYIARTPTDPRHLNPIFPDGARVICVTRTAGMVVSGIPA